MLALSSQQVDTSPNAQSAEKTSFGQFELNLQTAELFKNGRRVRLSGQSAQLLVILVRRAGHLVSREDLRLALWPQDTYVDFDRGVNNCISRVRDALGDSVAIPHFIRPLPNKDIVLSPKLKALSNPNRSNKWFNPHRL